jgi:hypothetical protein
VVRWHSNLNRQDMLSVSLISFTFFIVILGEGRKNLDEQLENPEHFESLQPSSFRLRNLHVTFVWMEFLVLRVMNQATTKYFFAKKNY